MKQLYLKSIILAILSIISIKASAYDCEVDGIYYNLDATAKTASVTFGSTKYSNVVTIPSTITYNETTYSVTSIGVDAFSWCFDMTSVIIPNSVTTIGQNAFFDCSGLTSVTIGNGVTTIGQGAFSRCSNLISVTIGNCVTCIEKDAFNECRGLSSIKIPNSVTSIGEGAFQNCWGLSSIVVESGNSVYDSRNNCNAIIETASNTLVTGCKNAIIPSSVTAIGKLAFSGCNGLTSVTIPSNVTTIGEYAFFGCSGLTSVAIPSSVTSIGYKAFFGCGLTSIEIPSSVTSIGEKAFSDCSDLASIKIPNSVTSIGEGAFYGCTGLTSIVVESGNAVYDSRNNCNAIIETASNTLVTGCKNTHIPSSVTTIGFEAFGGCNGLISISIPNTVTNIEDWAFFNCSDLASVTIPNAITTINNGSFANCIGLTSVTIPNSVTSIGDFAFDGCSSLTSIEIPSSVTSIGDRAFCGCGLTSIEIPSSVTSIGNNAFQECRGLTSIEIPNSVTSIGSGAFQWCSDLTSVTIPNSVNSIGDEAFQYCSGLNSITSYITDVFETGELTFEGCDNATLYVPKGLVDTYRSTTDWNRFNKIEEISEIALTPYVKVTAEDGTVSWIGIEGVINGTNIEIYKDQFVSAIDRNTKGSIDLNEVWSESGGSGTHYQVKIIGNGAFCECSGLTSVTIPSSVDYIANNAFYWCDGLTSINIPSSVTCIGNGAFLGCTNLTSIVVESGNSVYDSRNNCNAIIEKSTNKLIAGCMYTKIPSNVTSIENYAFFYCEYLAEVDLPSTLTSIGISSFEGCRGLTSITIPSSVTSIGEGAFSSCSGLTSITIPSSVTSIGEGAFYLCSGLTSIVVESGNTVYDSRNNSNAIIETASNTLIAGGRNSKIPSSVTSIGDNAFFLCTGLTSIEIPSSVTSIGNDAFSQCTGLTSIEIPSSVTSIGDGAFYSCKSLTSITSYITDVFKTGNNAFRSCDNATLYVPKGLVDTYRSTTDWNRFNKIEEISEIALTPYVKVTGEDGKVSWIEIEGDIDGTNIVIYKGYGESSIDENTQGVIDLNEVWSESGGKGIHYQVTGIGDYAFMNCSGLTSVTIPNSVLLIGYYAFHGCPDLTSIEIPSSVTCIEYRAFLGCSSLTSVTIPSSVMNIGEGAFAYCNGLTSIVVESGNAVYDSRNNCNAIIETASNILVAGCMNTKIPSNVTSIGNFAFSFCTGLPSVNIPSCVTNIGDYAFDGCTGLTSIEIPSNVTSIGNWAFRDCSGLTSITSFISDISETGLGAFEGCENATLYVPKGLVDTYQSIADWNRISNIVEMDEVEPENCEPYAVYQGGVLTFYYDDKKGTRDGTVYGLNNENSEPGWYTDHRKDITKVVFDNTFAGARPTSTYYWFAVKYNETSNLTEIQDIQNLNTSNVTNMEDMFLYCSSLTSLDVSHFDTGNVTSMSYMFYGCSGLTSLDVSHFDTSNVTSMGAMFSNCSNLTSLDVSHFDTSNVTAMGGMFSNCSNLTSLDVSHFDTSNVTSMGGMFANCSNLTSLDVSHFDTSNVTAIGYMFSNCSNLTSLDVSHFDTSNVTSMRCMFANCSNLTSLDVSHFDINNVTTMSSMFDGCSSLTSLDVNHFDTSNVTYMGSMFSYCSNLTSLDLSHFDTRNVTNMRAMFYGCSNLMSLDLSHFDTGNVADMEYMLSRCSGLKKLSISSTMSNIPANACDGVGSSSSPCVIIAPNGFNFGTDTSGNYFIWAGGYFCLRFTPGDVNNDGSIDISDVVALVNMILGNAEKNAAADVNNDGSVDISDVVTLVNMILNGTGTGSDDNSQAYLTCPDENHPHLIDLGLPSGTKWACCNVGAANPEDYGGYFAWGETEEKSCYNWSTYIHCDGLKETCHNLGSDIAGTQYDVAHVKWGGSWLMPSREQQEELRNYCTYTTISINGINCGKFTGQNGGTIFLPLAGYRMDEGYGSTGIYGDYWSSTQHPLYSNAAYRYLDFYSDDYYWDYRDRFYGFTIRPVTK